MSLKFFNKFQKQNLIKLSQSIYILITRKVKFHRDNADITVHQSRFISIFAFIHIVKISCEPVVFLALWIYSFIEIFLPFCLRLSADFDA